MLIVEQLDNLQQLFELIQNAMRGVVEETPNKEQAEGPEKPMTVREASEYLSLSVPTIYTLISKGELPVKKRSKRCYFFASDLNNYLKAGGRKREPYSRREKTTQKRADNLKSNPNEK